ncbi:MAG: hypothetical protein ACREKK_09300, partial [Candidatus Methylomirabilales bacterium]
MPGLPRAETVFVLLILGAVLLGCLVGALHLVPPAVLPWNLDRAGRRRRYSRCPIRNVAWLVEPRGWT